MTRKQILKIGFTFIVIFLAGLGSVNAQSASDRAQAYYFEAATAFENRNYQKAIDYCQEVENILGNSNARLEVLRLKSYYALGNATKAKNSLTNFYNYNSDESLKREVANYIVKIEDIEKKEKERIEYENSLMTCTKCYGDGIYKEKYSCFKCNNGEVSKRVTCSVCRGTGDGETKTDWLGGRTTYSCKSCRGAKSHSVKTKCHHCNGKTYNIKVETCSRCKGEGKIPK